MRAGTHLLTGMLTGFLFGVHLRAATDVCLLLAGAAAVGSILPDIDHEHAAIRQRLGIVGNIGLGWLKHRGATHTAIAAALVLFIGHHFHPLYGLALGIGYCAHILGDMLTVSGVAVLAPVVKDSLHLLPGPLRITTGGRAERLMAFLLFTVVLWVVSERTGAMVHVSHWVNVLAGRWR